MSQTTIDSAIGHTHTWRRDATTYAFGALLAISVSLAALEYLWPGVVHALRYDRNAVLQGELWRLITAHLVHADTQHLALNMLGTVLVGALFLQTYTVRQWTFVLAVAALSVVLGLLCLDPDLEWYVGASGMLHGALPAGAIGWWRRGERRLSIALAFVLLAKLVWEQWQGALPLGTDVAVVVDSHVFGALGGAIGGTLVSAYQKRGRSRAASL